MERHGHLKLDAEVRRLVLAARAATIDRMLACAKVIDLLPVRSGDSFAHWLEIADKVGIGAETVSRWLNALAFPEHRIRSDRRRDQAPFLQCCERGLQPSLTRTDYSAGRVSALLNMPPPITVASTEETFRTILTAFAPSLIYCAVSFFSFEP
jgi:hypothetical protein